MSDNVEKTDLKLGAIEDGIVEIVSSKEKFELDRTTEGISITGFIDVEKIIRLGFQRFFIEKKLPFQILIIKRPLLSKVEELQEK
ncbi:hypothetical protein [Clostridium formicaceticum]|uniref:Uncharacterized protein n=1 Tax=Clostridium formicaceticum TaxID=1497 RepID=A0AAC9RK13_9CLOT|nr:hypothetical protein [Clostridium formicaceticum]AOY77959.1 hypothetical protein BJL90_20080 [Clostridium formicaceticum]ARE88581.1 hypothetical protein CLFO_29870 [Clostridium formicaceticum]